MKRKFGIHYFVAETLSIEPLDDEIDITDTGLEFAVEIVDGSEYNGNGHKHMKIYTKGKLDEIKSGNWKISPMIKMPYDWKGYYVEMQLSDSNNSVIKLEEKPDNLSGVTKSSFELDVEWVFNTISKIEKINDKEHFKLMEELEEINSLISDTLDDVPLDSMLKKYRLMLHIINSFNGFKSELDVQQYDFTKNKINQVIDIFNKIKLSKQD